MTGRRGRLITGGITLVAVGVAAGWAFAQIPKALYVNGKVVSVNVIHKDKRAYVPLTDVARAFGMDLKMRSGGFELTTKTTSEPSSASTLGKFGEPASNGQCTLTVVEVVRRADYKKRYTWGDEEATPGNEVIAVILRLRNDTGRPASIDLGGNSGTALSDDADRTYSPRTRLPDIPSPGVTLLPQASVEFAVIFQVPKTAVLREFRYEPLITQDSKFKSGLFRISLVGQALPANKR